MAMQRIRKWARSVCSCTACQAFSVCSLSDRLRRSPRRAGHDGLIEQNPCVFEALEPRMLLSTTLVGGLLTIEGTANQDQHRVGDGVVTCDGLCD